MFNTKFQADELKPKDRILCFGMNWEVMKVEPLYKGASVYLKVFIKAPKTQNQLEPDKAMLIRQTNFTFNGYRPNS